MDAKDLFGVSSPKLVKTQTKSDGQPQPVADPNLSYTDRVYMERLERLYAGQIPTPHRIETTFRHSGWATDRIRVCQALETSGVADKRVVRFCACGAASYVEWSPSRQKHRVKAFHCGDRFCLPCAQTRAVKVKENLMKWTENEKVQFDTFTLRASDDTLATMLTRIIRCFSKVRESVLWRVGVKAGAYVVEIKLGEGSGKWHVHLHVLTIGKGVVQRELRKEWERVTGDSFIVDVQDLSHREEGVRYVAKYATKGWTQEVLQHPDALRECVIALRGRRLLGTFGEWRGRKLEGDDGAERDWRMVGSVRHVFAEALRGERWAIGVWRSLGLTVHDVEGNPVFAPTSLPAPRRPRRREDPPGA